MLSPKKIACRSIVCLLLAISVSHSGWAQSIAEHFDRDETVRRIVLTLATDEESEPIDETLALDLGLGFPFWLGSLGRSVDEPIPFGAVSEQSDPARTLAAGQRRTFTFDIHGVEDSDPMRSLPALLDDVRVSDISRIGLLASGKSDWSLNELSITINDKAFFSVMGIDANVQNEQALAEVRLRELREQVDPMVVQATALLELVRSGLATEAEEQQLADLDEVIVPKQQELSRIQRQLAGSYPWYLARGFQSPWRNGHYVESMSVTLITASHAGADTSNYVYYQTGGRKYLLSSPVNPLNSDQGPQVESIDLIGGPITAGDLRGHSLGMLGHSSPFADAPDRCHVQRMLVEVDGRIVYDSEENEMDRMSLEATRLIPPAHLNAAGDVVANVPVAREAFVWTAGKGLGLDLVDGGAHELPLPTDPTWPQPEPGLVYDAQVESMEQLQPGFQEGFEPFPGESYDTPDWSVSYEESYHAEGDFPVDGVIIPGSDPWAGDPWAGDPWAGDPWAGDPWADDPWAEHPPGWGAPSSWLDFLAGALFGRFGIDITVIEEFIDEAVADPIGEPPQIEHLYWDVFSLMTGEILWDVTGDESDIARYEVDLFMFWPQRDDPIGACVATMTASPGQRSVMVDLDPTLYHHEVSTDLNSAYTIPRITPIMLSTGEPGPGQFGIVQAANLGHKPIVAANPTYRYVDSGGIVDDRVLMVGEPLASLERAAWLEAAPATHLGFVFGPSYIGKHIAFRSAVDDAYAAYAFEVADPVDFDCAIVAHLGFLHEALETDNSVDVRLQVNQYDSAGVAIGGHSMPPRSIGPMTAGSAHPMTPIKLDVPAVIDPVTTLPIPAKLQVIVMVEGGNVDPAHPPVIVDLRLVQF